MALPVSAPPKPLPVSLTKWKIYCGCFLAAWAVLMFGFGLWPDVIAHWRMALVMIFGSLVAGLCIFQFVWTLSQTAKTQAEWMFVAGAMVVAGLTLTLLYKQGKKGQELT